MRVDTCRSWTMTRGVGIGCRTTCVRDTWHLHNRLSHLQRAWGLCDSRAWCQARMPVSPVTRFCKRGRGCHLEVDLHTPGTSGDKVTPPSPSFASKTLDRVGVPSSLEGGGTTCSPTGRIRRSLPKEFLLLSLAS